MLRTTALTLGLAMMAGSAMAASGSASTAATVSAANTGPQSGGAGSEAALKAEFHRLDTNNDGVLSPSEAKADPKVAKLYRSMDNSASIKTDPYANKSDERAGGITLNQFVAGMEAASGGAAGPAVSGGQTYILMRNGSKQPVSQTTGGTSARSMSNGMRQQPRNSAGSAMGATDNQSMNGGGSMMSSQNSRMQNRAMQGQTRGRGDQMGEPLHNGVPPQSTNGDMNTSGGVQGQSSMPMGTSD